MAASELIDSIYDVSSIQKEADQVSLIAESTRKLIAEIRASKDVTNLSNASKTLNDNMVQGQKAVDNYTAAQKQLIATNEKLASVRSKENMELEQKKKLLKEEQDLMKLELILNDKDAGSREKAIALNKKLEIEKNKLNLETKEGIARLKEINAQQDKNNELIEASSNKLQTQKIWIGNYKSGFADLTNQFKNGEIGAGGFARGMLNIGKATLVALWPVGLVAAALGLLYAVFKNFAPLIDKIEQGFAALTAAWSVLKNSLGQFLSGNKSLKESMSGVGDSMKQAARDAIDLKKAEQDLADATGGLEVANKKLETQMKQLLLQSKNKTLSEAEQMKLIDQAIELENQQFANKKKINDEELRISLEDIRIKNKLTAEQYENLKQLGVDYAEELKDQGVQISEADVDRLKAALIANEDIQQESIGIVEKAMNRKDALEEKAAAAAEKRNEKTLSAQEKTAELAEKLAANAVKFKEEEVDIFEDFVIEETEAEKKKAKDLDELNEAMIQNTIDKKKIEYDQKVLFLRKNSKDEEDFAKKKFDLDKSILQASIDSNLKDLQSSEISAAKKLEIGTKIAQAQIDLDNMVLDNFKDNENEKLDKFIAVADQLISAGMEMVSAIADYYAQQSEQRLAELDAEQEKSDEYFTKRQENLDNAIMSDISREEAQKKLAEDKAKSDKAIADKVKAEKIKAAKLEKAQGIISATINTAMAVIKMLADPGGILGGILAVAAGITGGFQIAKIASQQIPAYATGGITGNEAASLWGEVRPEVAVTPSGEIMFAERPTLSKFDAGTRIFKSVEDFERNMATTNQQSKGFEFDYDKMAAAMPRDSFELNGNGSWTMINKSNNRRTVINRRYQIGN